LNLARVTKSSKLGQHKIEGVSKIRVVRESQTRLN
jgi:hypothetical protein